MKKKFLTFIFAICLIIPAIFCLSGCVKDENPPVTYVVQFYNYDGTFIKEISVEENSSATYEIPTKESTQYYVYEFSNWEFLDGTDATDALSSVSKTLTVRAKFNEVQPTYTINFYDEDGQLLETKQVLRGENSSFATNPTKQSDSLYTYEFDCWVDENDNEIDNLNNVQSNLNLYAKYNNVGQHSFAVKFYAEDEQTILKEAIISNGSSITYTTTKPTSIDGYVYELDYWADSKGNKITNVYNDLNLYPVFSLNIIDTINNLKYSISEDETYYTLGASTTKTTSAHIEIMSEINSIPVTKIAESTFEECLTLQSVVIGTNVTFIDATAFRNCRALTSITIGKNLERVYGGAFEYCPLLTDINYLGNINEWVSIYFAFNANPLLNGGALKIDGKIVTSANITTATIINTNVFCGYQFLESVTIGNSVTEIGVGAFFGTGLKSVEIPSSVLKIGDNSFAQSSSLISATINCGIIEQNAFNNCAYLEDLTIGENVTSIGQFAFQSCESLNSVTVISETIANDIINHGYDIFEFIYTETIYIKTGLEVTNSTYLLENFTKQETSDKAGYDMYVRNAE